MLIPRLSSAWLWLLAEVVGTAAFALGKSARANAIENVGPVVGRRRILRTVRAMFVHNVQLYLSLFARRPEKFDLSEHELHGWQHFHQALEGGKGCLLVSPHLGDINYFAEVFIASGLPVSVLVEDLKPKKLRDLIVKQRARRGCHVIVGGPGALRRVYQALDRNEVVALISDRDIEADGYPVRFFGRDVTMPGLAFAIASRRRVPVVFGAAVRLSNGLIRSDVRPGFVPSSDIQTNVEQMATIFEEFIRPFPTHWQAFQPLPRPRSAARKEAA